MKLSILIPTHNYDCTRLVQQLAKRAGSWADAGDVEVIVGDDGSTDAEVVAAINAVAAAMDCVRIVRPAHNLGRAGILNLLAEHAAGEWLLVVDSDAEVPPTFDLHDYVAQGARADVVCGGLRHPDVNPNPLATLRYCYERRADRRRAAACRQQHPYQSLSTFNLLVRRTTFLSIRFDKDCTEYGYEDALFGVELMHRGIAILHTDHYLIHVGLEANEVFLRKTETALRVLRHLGPRMAEYSYVGRTAAHLQRWHLAWLVRLCYRATSPLLRANLLGRHPSLFLFSCYKLGYYLSLP